MFYFTCDHSLMRESFIGSYRFVEQRRWLTPTRLPPRPSVSAASSCLSQPLQPSLLVLHWISTCATLSTPPDRQRRSKVELLRQGDSHRCWRLATHRTSILVLCEADNVFAIVISPHSISTGVRGHQWTRRSSVRTHTRVWTAPPRYGTPRSLYLLSASYLTPDNEGGLLLVSPRFYTIFGDLTRDLIEWKVDRSSAWGLIPPTTYTPYPPGLWWVTGSYVSRQSTQ